MEERDLYFVDRALMDFAAAGEEGWEGREGDVRVKALWVHPIKVSDRVYGVSWRRADGAVTSRLMTSNAYSCIIRRVDVAPIPESC